MNSNAEKFSFQGQELQDDLGLGWLQFKWRNHDPAIGRFFNIDPLTEKYTDWGPYVFSGNRVIDSRELEGLEPYSVHASQEEAAINFAQQYNGISIRSGREVGTLFYSSTDANGNTSYSYTTPYLGTAGFVDPNNAAPIPEGTTLVGDGHTHAEDSNAESLLVGIENPERYGDNFPSGEDLDLSDQNASDNPNFGADYTVTPNGSLFGYTPNGNTGDARNDDVKKVNANGTQNIPSDPNSSSRSTTVSPKVTPDVLPVNVEEDNFKQQ